MAYGDSWGTDGTPEPRGQPFRGETFLKSQSGSKVLCLDVPSPVARACHGLLAVFLVLNLDLGSTSRTLGTTNANTCQHMSKLRKSLGYSKYLSNRMGVPDLSVGVDVYVYNHCRNAWTTRGQSRKTKEATIITTVARSAPVGATEGRGYGCCFLCFY